MKQIILGLKNQDRYFDNEYLFFIGKTFSEKINFLNSFEIRLEDLKMDNDLKNDLQNREDYATTVEKNEDEIMEAYKDSIENIDDVPEDFIIAWVEANE